MASLAGTATFTTPATGGAAGGAEVAALNPAGTTLFVVGPDGVDALDAATGARLYALPRSAVLSAGAPVALGTGNSAAVSPDGTLLAVSFDGAPRTGPGLVALYDLAPGAATFRTSFPVGAVPDQVVFTADGSRVLVAIEGEPAEDYAADPAGGVAVIDVAAGTTSFAGFGAFDNAALRAAGVRLTGRADPAAAANTATAARDLEPEYIALSADNTRAYVTLQEGNALGVLALDAPGGPTFLSVLPFGLKDHLLPGQELDTSDRDGGARIVNAPVFGLYQPDGVAALESGGRRYVVTANEGDAREWGNFVEEIRVGAPAYRLDPAAFPDAATLEADAALGRLTVSRHTGDTDGDGDFDQIHVFGGRSLSVWEVTDTALTRVYDSGSQIESILAAEYPQLLDDTRSDNKGPEPEGLTLATIDGAPHALVGLERSNAVLAFRIDSPADLSFAGLFSNPGDVGPEVFAASRDGTRLYVANEVSATTTAYELTPAASDTFTLQILHASDFEAGVEAVTRAPNFAAIVDALEDTFSNSITLSSGDNFIPSPFTAAGTDPVTLPALRAFYEQLLALSAGSLTLASPPGFNQLDVAILNAIGVQASAIGNHEFDLGPNPFAATFDFTAGAAGTPASITSIGALFPYVSANLDFSAEPALRPLFTATLRDAASFGTTASDLATSAAIAAEAADQQVAPWTTIQENGETIGVLGLTTQVLASISSIGGVRVLDPAGDGGVDNTDELAAILQPYVDRMTAQGVDKIILLSHLQQFGNELSLAGKLAGVDVVIAGGSHSVFADGTDVLQPGDVAASPYPTFIAGTDGSPVAVINTGANYTYVGRLAVTFDANGVLIPGSVDPAVSGAYVTTDAGVDAVAGNGDGVLDAAERAAFFADGTRGGEVAQLTAPVGAVIAAKDGNVFGLTDVFLEGRRGEVRIEETNLGDLSADANLYVARQVDPGVIASIKNGGGIRAEIGAVIGQPVAVEVPPQADLFSGKPLGGVSQLDIENSLRFNNALSVVTVTAAEFERLLEHAVAATAPGATPGQFGQFGGLSFSFDATLQSQVIGAGGAVTREGLRMRDAALLNDDGSVADELVRDGVLVGDASRAVKFVTLSFLADGGDGYPINSYADGRTDLLDAASLTDGTATFAAKGSEQDALAEFLRARHSDAASAYGQPDLGPAGDARAQNLADRAADVFQFTLTGAGTIAGTAANELITGSAGDDAITAGAGRDTVRGGAGFDTLTFGRARADGGLLYDATGGAPVGYTFADPLAGTSTTRFTGIERLVFADGALDLGPGTVPAAGVTLYGGIGNDALTGGPGNDVLEGGPGTDTTVGLAGDDIHVVDREADAVVEAAGGGYDAVIATGASYRLAGNVEVLLGIGAAQRLTGGTGNELIAGGGGADVLAGGAGRDTFAFAAGPTGAASITDYASGQDVLLLSGYEVDTAGEALAALTRQGSGTLLDLGGGTTVLLAGTAVAQFTAADFLFA